MALRFKTSLLVFHWSAVALRFKTSLLVFLFLLIYLSSSGIAEGFQDNANPMYSLHRGGIQMNSRKLLGVDTVLDYDYTGPNPKHGKGKQGGGGGRNP